jgi:cytochrome c oxidase assembly protein subunit 15
MQGVLGGLTVIFHLKPGFVIGHFLLSMVILCAAVALYWRARREPEQLAQRRGPQAGRGRRGCCCRSALWPSPPGTLATAAGPHAGENEEQDPVSRLDTFGHARHRSSTGTGAPGRCSASPRSPCGSWPGAGAAGPSCGAR